MPIKTWLSWSTGKDSALALHKLLKNPEIEVTGLFCTVSSAFQRVSMHGVRLQLLKLQAQRLQLPLAIVTLPHPCSDDSYGKVMADWLSTAREQGVEAFAFGDIFLEDIRRYRERQLSAFGMMALFPLWNNPTASLAREVIDSGIQAVISCLDTKVMPPYLLGNFFTLDYLNVLPKTVDPCGENGEYHSFVTDSPLFSRKIQVELGQLHQSNELLYQDLLTAEPACETLMRVFLSSKVQNIW